MKSIIINRKLKDCMCLLKNIHTFGNILTIQRLSPSIDADFNYFILIYIIATNIFITYVNILDRFIKSYKRTKHPTYLSLD